MIVFQHLPDYNLESAQIVQDARGHYTVNWVFVEELMEADEREQYAEFKRSMEGAPEFEGPPPPKFGTLEDASEFARCTAWITHVYDDLHAYNAPSECYSKALHPAEEALERAANRSLIETA
jgi:hypothetical protein